MTTFDWQFSMFEKAPSEGQFIDVVKVIHWRIIATDGAYVASSYGSAALGEPDPDNYLAYDSITKQWAIDAVSATIDVPAIQASLESEINAQKNPTQVPAAPPFSN